MLKKKPVLKTNLFIDIKTNLPVYTGLFIVLCIVRFPSFFFSVFDWDESTLILMGQSILNGHIPYVAAWDIKPPLVFYIYALFIFLFGKSIASIRIGGMLCVYIASIFIYKTGEVIHNKTAAIISALFLIVSVSSDFSGLSTMPEHILLLPLTFILYLLLTTDMNKKIALITGVALGIAILIKTNMVFESFAICILLLSGLLNKGLRFFDRIKRLVILAIGILTPVVLMVYYYFMNDKIDLFLKTNIAATFAYAVITEASPADRLNIFLLNIQQNIRANSLLWTTFFLGTFYLFFRKKGKNLFLFITLIIFIAQMFSLFTIMQPFGHHYLITSMPIMCLISGVALSQWLSENKFRKQIIYPLTITLIVAGLSYSLQRNVAKYYKEIFLQFIHGQPLMNDSCYKIADFLRNEDVKGQYIYMVNSCQIVYWLTESRYPTIYIHPSNLLEKEFMLKLMDGPDASREKELLRILGKRPKFIIRKRASWPKHLDNFKSILENELEVNYGLTNIIDTYYYIYKRKSQDQTN